MNPRLQKPTILCRSHVQRCHPTPLRTVRPRRHVLTPGHQTTIHEKARTTRRRAPTPLILRPDLPASRSSCNSMSLDTSQMPKGTESPRSLAEYGSNRRFLTSALRLREMLTA